MFLTVIAIFLWINVFAMLFRLQCDVWMFPKSPNVIQLLQHQLAWPFKEALGSVAVHTGMCAKHCLNIHWNLCVTLRSVFMDFANCGNESKTDFWLIVSVLLTISSLQTCLSVQTPAKRFHQACGRPSHGVRHHCCRWRYGNHHPKHKTGHSSPSLKLPKCTE